MPGTAPWACPTGAWCRSQRGAGHPNPGRRQLRAPFVARAAAPPAHAPHRPAISARPCSAGRLQLSQAAFHAWLVSGALARRFGGFLLCRACLRAALHVPQLRCCRAWRRVVVQLLLVPLGRVRPGPSTRPPPPPPGGGRRQVFGRHVACRPPAGRQRDCSERSAGSGRQTQRPPGAQLSASFVKFCWPAPAAAAVCGAVL